MSESKFKVGDRVRVYGHSDCARESFGGVVKEIHGAWLKVYSDGGSLVAAHPKQCRKLVKKERRRVWVNRGYLAQLPNDPGGYICSVPPAKSIETSYVEFIEVRRRK